MTFNTLGRQMPQSRDYGSQIVRAGLMREERNKRMKERAALASFQAETGRQAVDVDRISAEAREADVAQQKRLKSLGIEGSLMEQRLRNFGALTREKAAIAGGLEQSKIASAPAAQRAATEATAVAAQRETDEPLAKLGVHRAYLEEGMKSPFADYFEEGASTKVAEPSAFTKALELEDFAAPSGVSEVPEEEAEYGFGPRPLLKKDYKKRSPSSIYSKLFNFRG